MVYNSGMKRLKTTFLHFIISSFLIVVPCTQAFAEPGQEGFPPLPPPGQGLQEEDSSEKKLPPRPPMDSDNIINYRGTRTYSEDLPLKVTLVKCQRLADDVVCVEVLFNQSINPRSVRPNSFIINNTQLPLGTRFTFNKKGNTIKLMVYTTGNSFKLRVQDIKSFNGFLVEPIEILTEVTR